MQENSKKITLMIDFFVIILLLLLPYYIFQGKLFIGGDDTRLFYIYPFEFIQNIAFHSWYNFSSHGFYNPNQFSLPLLFVWSALSKIITSKVILDYLSFSLPLITGYIYFNKLNSVLFSYKYILEWKIGSLFYLFSPIIILNQLSIFLYSIWLIPLLPIISYYFLLFVRNGNYIYILKCVFFCILFSLGLFSIPWFLGFIIPTSLGLVLLLYFVDTEKNLIYIKRFSIFAIFLVCSQAFWLLPFLAPLFQNNSNSFVGQALSQSSVDTFSSTVISTATGNILYPLLAHNHRQIAFDYDWGIKTIFENYYDALLIANGIYLGIVAFGLLAAKKLLKKEEYISYVVILSMFLFALFLYTVNIGIFKDIFLSFQSIPGIAMFRNFYDKFALGYIFIYSILFAYSLIIFNKKFPNKRILINILVTCVIVLNALPIKYIIDRPLWKTEDIKLNITIPYEYMQFINEVKQTVPSSASIFSLPYNQASYSFIKDQNSDNIFSGTSPIKIFTGITEYSGNLSFPPNESVNINKAIINRDYNTLNSILSKYNISYLIVTKNIPSEVLNSYLFDLYSIKEQDSNLIDAISKRKLHVSSNGNYELYQLKTNSNILRSGNIYFKKRNQIEYHIHLSNIKEAQVVAFVDSFHPGWELYLSKHSNNECNDVYKYSEEGRECRTDTQLMNWNEPNILFAKPLFKQTHTQYQQFGNQWKISMDELKNNRLIKSSPDGKYDLDLILYFRPQAFFYIGILISTVSILILTLLILVRKKK